ncbi:MAG: hypothetical protein SGI90_04100 [Candidatus Eisenbacteria bacterium]|nr:hypothetical protein [Candidatus Eisenbacteria bacterium]
MKLVIRSFLFAAGLVLVASPSFAGLNQNAKIFMHVGPVVAKNGCTQVPTDCRNASVAGNVGSFYHAYVGVGNFSDSVGVAGCQFGIQYNDASSAGVDIFNWTLCATLEFASNNWPLNNSGNLVTWDPVSNCQLGPNPAVAGFFYLGAYTPDRIALIPRPGDGRAKVASCLSVEDDLTGQTPSPLGYIDFGTGPGYNPCSTIVPVANATWSAVKSLIR